jgi:hypothetical protein
MPLWKLYHIFLHSKKEMRDSNWRDDLMSTYYEILQIQPNSSNAEIQAAVDLQYNQWRRLVTIHDPKMVNQANQALQALETIRSTLTDPGKRSVYDAAIGVNDVVGGILDPNFTGSSFSTSQGLPTDSSMHSTSNTPVVPSKASRRTDAWVCPKCQTANKIGSQYCESCGTKISHKCPKCKKATEIGNAFCPYCGADKKAVFQKKLDDEVTGFQAQISAIQMEIQTIENIKGNGSFNQKFLRVMGSGWSSEEKKIADQLRAQSSQSPLLVLALLAGLPALLGMMAGGMAQSGDAAGVLFVIGLIIGVVILGNRMQKERQLKATQLIAKKRNQIQELEDQVRVIQARAYID